MLLQKNPQLYWYEIHNAINYGAESVKDTFILGKNYKKVMHKHVSLYFYRLYQENAFLAGAKFTVE